MYCKCALKSTVPVISKKNVEKKYIFCCRLEGHWRKEQDPELTDPEHWIKAKSRWGEGVAVPIIL